LKKKALKKTKKERDKQNWRRTGEESGGGIKTQLDCPSGDDASIVKNPERDIAGGPRIAGMKGSEEGEPSGTAFAGKKRTSSEKKGRSEKKQGRANTLTDFVPLVDSSKNLKRIEERNRLKGPDK